MFMMPYYPCINKKYTGIPMHLFLSENVKNISDLDELKNISNCYDDSNKFKKKLTKKFFLKENNCTGSSILSIIDDHDQLYADIYMDDTIYIISDTILLVSTAIGDICAIQYGRFDTIFTEKISIENSVISSNGGRWFVKDRKYLYIRIDKNVYMNISNYRKYRLKIALVDDNFNIIKELKFKDIWFKQHIATKKDYTYLLLQNRDWVSTHIITVDLKNYRMYKFKIKKNMINFSSQLNENIINKYLICEYQDGTFSLIDLTTGKTIYKNIANVKHYKKKVVLTLKNGKKIPISKI